jgi:integrase
MGLFKRKNSPYYFMKFQLNGQRIYESTKTKNKKLAEEIYQNRRNQILYGEKPLIKEPIKQITFVELAKKYKDWINGRQKSAKNKGYVINALVNSLGNLRLIDFSVELVEKIQTDLLKEKSIVSSNRTIAIIQAMFTKALDWEMIKEEDLKRVRKVKQLKGEAKRLRYLSDDEAERLIYNCDKNLKNIVITALNTGMRKSEILKLTWDRVDLRNRIILLDKTKNGQRREIPINNTLLNVLSDIIRNLKTDYMFYNPETLKPYCDIQKSFTTALKKSKIFDFHFHDLRHTFASRLVMAGIDLTTVKELLGHKDIKMTLRYSHLSQAHIKKAVEILDDRCKIVALDNKEKIKEV